MGLTILFIHLKIILLQCFQFSTTISSIQTHPQCSLILARDETSSSITSESDKPSANEFLFFYFFILLSRIQQTNY